jgi:hypothetical protein
MSGAPPIARRGDVPVASLACEIKHVLPAAVAGQLAGWLGVACRPERARPPAWVVSVYFDTPGLALLDEKVNSDYHKTKVRVRWYRALDGSVAGPAFVEIKRRIGNRRDKHRMQLELEAGALARWSLDDPRWRSMLAPVAAHAPLPARLGPVLRIEYLRTRFLDAGSAARLAVDRRIAVTAAATRLRARPLPAALAEAVFEWKGPSADLPAHLAPITRFGARRRSFSKYLAGAQAACPHLA